MYDVCPIIKLYIATIILKFQHAIGFLPTLTLFITLAHTTPTQYL